MNLEIKELDSKESSICLNMIVKNESHIIANTLENICDNIDISYWVISDTGSTDNTKEIITNFFKEKNIPGEIFDDKWQDFGYNRTKALEHAYNKTDYLLIFDADDKFFGKLVLPDKLDKDRYSLKFGDPNSGISYNRTLLINNRKKFKFVGVLHEYISFKEGETHDNSICMIDGEYFINSGKTGARSNDPDKYKKDAVTLEKAYKDEKDEALKSRYAFYCAQSYRDYDNKLKAIEWYKKCLLKNWEQEKYYACLMIGQLYLKLGEKEKALHYFVKSGSFDNKRIEGIFRACQLYRAEEMHDQVIALYEQYKDYRSHIGLLDTKLFVNKTAYMGHFDEVASISACYSAKPHLGFPICRDLIIGCKIGEIVLLAISNLQFYLKFFTPEKGFELLISIYNILNQVSLIEPHHKTTLDFINNKLKSSLNDEQKRMIKLFQKQYEKKISSKEKKNIIKNKEYKNSKKILIYTGPMYHEWNHDDFNHKSLGGSEKAVVYLANNLPKNFDIYITGMVKEKTFGNIKYVNESNLQKLLNNNDFHTIIVSRYSCFMERFENIKCTQLYLSIHDTYILGLNGINIHNSLNKNINNIDGVIVLTETHKKMILQKYPMIKDKMNIINNGIELDAFNSDKTSCKVKNSFIWSSCSERGLDILLNMWDKILADMPDATLQICSYDTFPKTQDDNKMLKIINKYDSITHLGKLNKKDLYSLMSKTEFWLYTCTFPETSCITALELLMSEVICVYYPVAALVDTVGDYGIPIKRGDEVKTIMGLTDEKKKAIQIRGKKYAMSCSWKHRYEKWENVLGLSNKWIFYCSPKFETKMIRQYIDNLNGVYPEYNIYLTNDKNMILRENPSKITFIFGVFDNGMVTKFPNTEFSVLNTEPLNIPLRLKYILNHLKIFPNIKYYDYSKSNLKILEENGINIQNKIYLPYKCNDEELKKLTNFNKKFKKVYDFGILKSSQGENTDRRLKIINFLKENSFTVNTIQGWGDDRDIELAKCKTILNIHGFCEIPSNIFEHIRCDRLLQSGFNVLSETSYKLNDDFANKYPKLKQITYDDFLNIDIINNYR